MQIGHEHYHVHFSHQVVGTDVNGIFHKDKFAFSGKNNSDGPMN